METTVFPIRKSANKHFFVDSTNKPFFYNADTCWKLFWEFTSDEAEFYLKNRKETGFTVIQVQLLPYRAYQCNRYGDNPFNARGDMTKPNEAYFKHVDRILEMASELGLGMLIAPVWLSKWEQEWYRIFNAENAASYGRYLAARYKRFSNVIGWIHGGDDDAIELHDAIRICGSAMNQEAPYQFNTFHGYVKGGWQFFRNEKWYDLYMAYAYDYQDALRQLTEAYGLTPANPVFLGETHYERNFGITSSLLRKYAYTSVLLGTAGQAYGHNDIWMSTCFWKQALKAEAGLNMGCLKRFFCSLGWHKLTPDFDHLFANGLSASDQSNVPAATAMDGSTAVIYIPNRSIVTVDLSHLKKELKAYWCDPTSCKYHNADLGLRQDTDLMNNKCCFSTPGYNMGGDDDWLLFFM